MFCFMVAVQIPERPYGTYVMENVLFKNIVPAEFHSQTAPSRHPAQRTHAGTGENSGDISSIRIRTPRFMHAIIDKKGPFSNPAIAIIASSTSSPSL